ncbi:dTDP-4-dehydrorhamnose reductase [Massilia sp. R2A-15]|uniref:dTDP-4-dehydrorhamnose reductase n=1 Tax=Massilia sp. R2A-15 TaxID=3064278 RepID=UPI002732FCCC|nr:dTDP-4-dehydrorhamnose reductase [Massilia sp. R2A-15]WLI88026.1 dTDP-4-dehydrorhamnose reductase [Massilia sp. R2A-15]
MKILLTGKNGQVGYELERSLQALGEVVAVDRSQMDLSDLRQVREVIRAVRPHLIVNPAAYTAVDRAESEPALALRINGEAPAVMADEAKKLGAGIIHYSTDYVFDGTKETAYVETDATCPINAYGATKLAGEQAIQAAGVPHLILRTSWVYGMRGKNFLLTVMRLAGERDELRIVADQFGSPTWCRTVADTTAQLVARLDARSGVVEAMAGELGGIYHLTASGRTSWHGFTEEIVRHASIARKPRVTAIRTEEYPLPAKRPRNSELSGERLRSLNLHMPHWQHALALCQG